MQPCGDGDGETMGADKASETRSADIAGAADHEDSEEERDETGDEDISESDDGEPPNHRSNGGPFQSGRGSRMRHRTPNPTTAADRAGRAEADRRRRAVVSDAVARAATAAILRMSNHPRWNSGMYDEHFFHDDAARQPPPPRYSYHDDYEDPIDSLRAVLSSLLSGLRVLVRMARLTALISAIAMVLWVLGLATYAALYWAVMPTHSVQAPAYFDYDFLPERHLTGPYGRYMSRLERRAGAGAVSRGSRRAESLQSGGEFGFEEDVCGVERQDELFCERDAADRGASSFDGDPIGGCEGALDRCRSEALSSLLPDHPSFDESEDEGDGVPIEGATRGNASQQKQQRRAHRPPTAVIDLLAGHTQWTPRITEVVPRRRSDGLLDDQLNRSRSERGQGRGRGQGVLPPGRRHYVEVSLTLPESDANRRAGVFMVRVDLLSYNGAVLASSDRAAALPHESAFVSTARKVVLLGPTLLGAVVEARTVDVGCFDNYVESASMPLAAVAVRLVSPPWPSERGRTQVQVLSAEVRIGKELNALQRSMKEWFYTCGTVGMLVFMICYALFGLVAMAVGKRSWKRYRRRAARRTRRERGAAWRRGEGRDGNFGSDEPHADGTHFMETESKPRRSDRFGNPEDVEHIDLGLTDSEFDDDFDPAEWEACSDTLQQRPDEGRNDRSTEQKGGSGLSESDNASRAVDSSSKDEMPCDSGATKADEKKGGRKEEGKASGKKMNVSVDKAEIKESGGSDSQHYEGRKQRSQEQEEC